MTSQQINQPQRASSSSDEDLEALELAQIETSRLQHILTLGSTRSDRLRKSAHEKSLSMGKGKKFPLQLPAADEYIVEFDGPDDPEHPFNWSFSVK